jgi:hypothetical protein
MFHTGDPNHYTIDMGGPTAEKEQYELVGFYFEDIIQNFEQRKVKDNKGVTRIRKSKKTRQYNYQKKRDKRTNNDL